MFREAPRTSHWLLGFLVAHLWFTKCYRQKFLLATTKFYEPRTMQLNIIQADEECALVVSNILEFRGHALTARSANFYLRLVGIP